MPDKFEGQNIEEPTEDLKPIEQKIDETIEEPKKIKANQEQQEIKNEAAWQRTSDYLKESHIFKYGETLPDHPAQLYIDSIVSRLPKKEGFPLKVYLSLDWKESDAFCLPDGTIFLGAGLLSKVDSEEALAGIINHEYVHGYREHAEKSKKEIKSIKELTKSIGVRRAHEYEADLRTCILDLEEAGISPVGYKLFLEKIHAEQEKGGIIHGSSMDRALNIAGATYSLDLKSLASGLHSMPMPEEVIQSVKKGGAINSHHFLWLHPKYFSYAPQHQKELRKARNESVENIPSEQLPFAIETTYEETVIGKDSDDKNLFTQFTERFLKESVPQDLGISEQERKALAVLGVHLSTAANILNGRKDIVGKFKEEVKETFSNPEGLEQARNLLKKHTEDLNIKYASHSTKGLMEDLLKYVVDNKIFGDFKKDDTNFPNFEQFIRNWSETLSQVSEKYDLIKIRSKEDLEKIAALYCVKSKNLPPKIREQIQVNFGVSPEEAKTEEREVSNKYFFDLGVSSCDRKPEKVSEFLLENKEILEQLKDGDISDVIDAAMNISNGIIIGNDNAIKKMSKSEAERYANFNPYFKNQEGEYSIMSDKIYFPPEYLLNIFIRRCLNELPQFALMSDFEKKIILLDSGLRCKLYEYSDRIKNKTTENDFGEKLCVPVGTFEKGCVNDIDKDILNKDFLFKNEKVDLKKIKSVYGWLIDPKKFRRHNVPGLTDEWSQKRIFAAYLNKYVGGKQLTEVVDSLNQLEDGDVPVQQIISSNREQCGKLILDIIDAIKTGGIDDISLNELLQSADWIADPFLSRIYRRFLMEKYLPNLSFDEKLNIFLPKDQTKAIFEPQTQEIFFESEINTKEQFHEIKKRIGEAVEGLTSEGSTEQGVASLLSTVGVSSLDVNEVLSNLLKSSYNDADLKTMIFEALASGEHEGEDDKFFVKRTVGKADEAVRSIYNMDGFAKQLLLRKLLTEKKGVLPDLNKRNKFLKFIFREWLEQKNNQKDVTNILQKVQVALGEIPEWQLVYFGLQSTLRDKVAVPPEKPIQWKDLDAVQMELEGLGLKKAAINRLLRTTLWSKVPKEAEGNPENYPTEYSQYAQQKLTSVLSKEIQLNEAKKEKLEPIEFVKEFASRTGAIGVRFLQLLPQFVELPQQYEAKFSEVYDGLKGQSKLAALALLEREYPQIWEEITEIGKRIGGGSVMTVYETKTKDGEEEVVKVRNPNVQYHLAETHRFASKILDSLAKQHGAGYTAARGALDDIKEWIEADINFRGFIEEDKKFYEKNNGFKPEGFEYSIKVPVSKAPDNPYFIREEKVVGKNLTKWNELVANKHDMKQVTSLLVKNYVSQIMDGRVHSDVHIGNFAVTDKKELVIFDRNFYLDLNAEEKELITAFVNPFAGGAEEKLLAYLKKSSQITKEKKVKQAIGELMKHTSVQEWDKAQSAIVKLKQEGLKIPLKLTLFVKNFNSLQMMARKAGFGNLVECFLYQPD